MDTSYPDTPGQETSRQIGIADLTRMVRERKLLIAVFVIGFGALGLAVSYVMPERYESSTVFLLKERSFLAQLYGPAFIQIPFKNNLANIRDDVLSFANLDQVARSLGLDSRINDDREWEELIGRIRANLDVQVRSQKFADDVITMTYADEDSNRCYRIANRVRDAYIESNVAGYQEEIRNLMDRYRERIKVLENQRASTRQNQTRFLQAHQTEVSGGAQRNTLLLDQKQKRMEELDTQIVAFQESDRLLQEEVTKESPKIEQKTIERNPEYVALELEARQIKKKIREMEVEKKYTDLHPNMIEGREQLARIEKDLEGIEDTVQTRVDILDNPRYHERRAELRETQQKLQLRLAQKKSLETEVAVLNNNLRALPSLLEQQRQLDDRLTGLGTELSETSASLRRMEDLWERSKEAGGTVYQIVEQARRPKAPVWPNRPLLLAVAAVLGLGLSAALAYFLELSRQTFGTAREAAERLGVPVMGAIELIVGPEELLQKRKRRIIALVTASFVILVGIALAVVVLQYPEALPEGLLDLIEKL